MKIVENADSSVSPRAEALKDTWGVENTHRTNRILGYVGLAQWALMIFLAIAYTPWTWVGETRFVHLHVWLAIFGGAALAIPPILISRKPNGHSVAKYVFTVSQVVFSCLLIHFSGGRIESHFHVFGSMALLSIYGSIRVILLATAIVAADHFLRGVFWPQSVFGVVTESPFRWIEHALWLSFENAFLIFAIYRHGRLLQLLAIRQSSLELFSSGFEEQVKKQMTELTERANWFEHSMASANAFTWACSENGTPFRLSSSFQAILGYDQSESSDGAQAFEKFVHADNIKGLRKQFRAANWSDNSKWELELQLKHASGQFRWFRMIGEVDKSDAKTMIGICIDIHDRRIAKLRQEKLQQEFSEISRRAGMATIANGVLHNVGNVLNSVNTSANQLAKLMHHSRLKALPDAAALLESHAGNLPEFFSSDSRGKVFSQYLGRLSGIWQSEFSAMKTEIKHLEKHLEHMREVIRMQQRFAGRTETREPLNLDEVVQGAVETMRPRLRGMEIQLVLSPGGLTNTITCRHSVLQILYNLISNAIDSVSESSNLDPERIIRVRTRYYRGSAEICVQDNGLGFSPEEGARLFQHGFTTKKDGHGFGLHSCALLAKSLGGELRAESGGSNQGAEMTLVLPCGEENCGWSPEEYDEEPRSNYPRTVISSSMRNENQVGPLVELFDSEQYSDETNPVFTGNNYSLH